MGPAPMMAAAPVMAAAPSPATAPHKHRGLFAARHCVECQRAYVKAHDGVDVPPPPGYPGAPGMPFPGGTIVSGPMVIQDPRAPGYAVVGEAPPGYAVVGGSMPGAEPSPIGVARAMNGPASGPRMAMNRPGAGPYDPAVVPSSIPPAPAAMSGPGHDRPHVISHLFGIPKFGRHYREREARRREQHAAIAYGEDNSKVTELPASMVYSRR
jgi:hypothetical protein